VVLAVSAGVVFSQGVSHEKGGKGAGGGSQESGLTLTSPDIEDGAVIPDKFTTKAGAAVVSPKLQWANVPQGTESFTLLFHDPDVAMGKKLDDISHWMIFNIPGSARELPGGIPAEPKLADGAIQIKNTGNRIGYMGPGPRLAGPYHHYMFELFALDRKLELTGAATRADVVQAMEGHILAKGVLTGRFQ